MKRLWKQSAGIRPGICLLVAGTIISIILIAKRTDRSAVQILEGEHEEADALASDAAQAAAYDWYMTRDIKTKKIPEGIRARELDQAQAIFARQSQSNRVTHHNSYSMQGPDNLGGRTRAIAYDVRFNGSTNQVILAGGVSGGVYKSVDNGATWVRKSPTNDLYSVTSIAQDTRAGFEDTWYYATGETLGNSASETGSFYFGNGIFKSTDNGETWARLPNSNAGALETFDARQDLVSKVVVNPVNGDVYMAALDIIFRSVDGGATWSQVLWSGAGSINTGMLSDIAVTSTGRFYAAFSGTCNTGPTNNLPGVWTSTTGAFGSWTKIAGDLAATNHANWNADGAYGRVVLGIAPSSENIVYAMYWDGTTNTTCPTANTEAELFRWDQNTTTWTDLSANLPNAPGECSPGNDPFAVQGGYDLVVAVKPDNPNVVFIGGTNIYRSNDAFATIANTRIGGYATASGAALYTNSHPDIHAIAFEPGNPTVMLCGNDGGIQRTNNDLAATVAWTPINSGYNTYQYYYVTVDPRSGNTKVMGGAQDNGTTRNLGGAGTSFEMVISGDGGSVGLSDEISGVTYEYASTQTGNIYRRASTFLPNTGVAIRPAAAVNSGLFITLFKLDNDNTELIYYANEHNLWRNTSASTATTANWTQMTGIGASVASGNFLTCLATTRGTYNASTASLFMGTDDGRVLRLDDPQNAAAATAPVDITNGSLPANAYISSIAVNPRNDDTVIVTISNYGAEGIFWTGNANSATPTWFAAEGNLTLPSIRSSAIAITNLGVEYFVGTSVGLFAGQIDGTDASTADATVWNQEGAGEIGNAVVSSLALRTSDNVLVIGTHGFGMWRTQLPAANLPVTFKSFRGRVETASNALTWEVEDESQNKGFEIERKYAGDQDYTKIGFIAGRNTSGTNRYDYTDHSVDLGKEVAFYRIRQVDYDERSTYSSVLPLGRKISSRMVEYMSVSGNNLFVRINNGNNNLTMNLRIFDMNGRQVKNLTTQYQSQQIDLSTLPRGTYVVEITGRDKRRVSRKIVR